MKTHTQEKTHTCGVDGHVQNCLSFGEVARGEATALAEEPCLWRVLRHCPLYQLVTGDGATGHRQFNSLSLFFFFSFFFFFKN